MNQAIIDVYLKMTLLCVVLRIRTDDLGPIVALFFSVHRYVDVFRPQSDVVYLPTSESAHVNSILPRDRACLGYLQIPSEVEKDQQIQHD
jgi:hypothetical protein